MSAIRNEDENNTVPGRLLTKPLPAVVAIRAIPAGRDKTPAPMMDLTRLKTSSGMVAVSEGDAVDCCFSFLRGALSSLSEAEDDTAHRRDLLLLVDRRADVGGLRDKDKAFAKRVVDRNDSLVDATATSATSTHSAARNGGCGVFMAMIMGSN